MKFVGILWAHNTFDWFVNHFQSWLIPLKYKLLTSEDEIQHRGAGWYHGMYTGTISQAMIGQVLSWCLVRPVSNIAEEGVDLCPSPYPSIQTCLIVV